MSRKLTAMRAPIEVNRVPAKQISVFALKYGKPLQEVFQAACDLMDDRKRKRKIGFV